MQSVGDPPELVGHRKLDAHAGGFDRAGILLTVLQRGSLTEQRLDAFAGRGAGYQRGMSSPLSARTRCSRLSVALATGTLSLREVVHRLRAAQSAGEGPVPARDLASDPRLGRLYLGGTVTTSSPEP